MSNCRFLKTHVMVTFAAEMSALFGSNISQFFSQIYFRKKHFQNHNIGPLVQNLV
jgi:hypothetical protein